MNISLCGVNGAQFDSYLYLLNDTNMIPIASDDNNCGTQSEISTSLCNSGTYYIVVDAVNSNDIGTFTLSLTEDANFSFSSEINIQNVTCASGNDGQINVNILGNGGQPPFDYYWYDINMNTLDSSLFSYSLLDSLTFLDTGIYILEIKDDRDCILRDTINLTSFASLELDITPNNPSICQGTSIDLTVDGGATYFRYPSSSLS